ncbi:response regulator [Pseudanabaena sp. FACHB-1998]|uniref:response regulator n=1 Tax=Pseudanabaena sp. FACHB-1998 TaxID=2692858 RepID=UPI0016819E5F|nr:response regulator [Pseudanabaena sp. FACHB-1998]MBD2179129.1 response regulator [Pseudanabaena sp. FACHB-1998]
MTDQFLSQSVFILLVEDNPADAELAIRALRRGRISNPIQVLKDGAEALDFIYCRGDYTHREFTDFPKLILLDLKLPKISGLDVLKHLKSDQSTQSIPIVVLTSSAQDSDVIESYKLGVNSYIVKPVDFEQFNQSIERLGFYWVVINKTPF